MSLRRAKSADEYVKWLNLETAVGSRKYAQALYAPGKFEKALITNKVTTSFSNLPCTSISCTSFSRLTAVSRLKQAVFEVPDHRKCLLYEAEELVRFPGFLEPPEQGVNKAYRDMQDGAYHFGREDLPFMDIAQDDADGSLLYATETNQ